MPQTSPFFIDKSKFIADLETSGQGIEMILNPNGMLTTANIEMLKKFYRYPAERSYFQTLAVGSSNAMRHQGAHYVVSLDFSTFNARSWDEAQAYFATCMSDLYKAFREIIDPDQNLDKYKQKKFSTVENKEAKKSELQYSLQYLLQFIKKSTECKPVLLVNGVDKPFEVAGMHGYTKAMSAFCNTFYVSWAKSSEWPKYLHRAILFGCSRVMEAGTFSGLNNIGVYSALRSDRHNDSFAYTEDEVKTLLDRHGLPYAMMSEIKQMAGGYVYCSDGNGMLMNPQLVVSHLQSVLSPTRAPTLELPNVQYYLSRAFETGAVTMDTFVRLLAQRESYRAKFQVIDYVSYDNMNEKETLLSYLVHQGLLAPVLRRSMSSRFETGGVELIIPNRIAYDEIKQAIFENPQFNKEHLPCPEFYPLACRLAEMAEAELQQRITNLKSASVAVVLNELKAIQELRSRLEHELYKPIADLLRSEHQALRDNATEVLRLFNMMNHPYVVAQLAAGVVTPPLPLATPPAEAQKAPSMPASVKPISQNQITMNANYREMIQDEYAHVSRKAFYDAMLAEEGRIKCFSAPGASFKSSLISMIEACFNTGFRPPETKQEWGDNTYPVLKFSFSNFNMKVDRWLKQELKHIAYQHPDALFDKGHIHSLLENEQAAHIMQYLVDVLYQFYQKPVIVLVDSASKPFFHDAISQDDTKVRFVRAFCSALLKNDKVRVAGLFGVNECAHLLFGVMDEKSTDSAMPEKSHLIDTLYHANLRLDVTEVKCYSTMHPNSFRKYFALSEVEAEDLIKQAYKVDDADIKPMIDQLKKACTLFTEAGTAYFHTWYACHHINELDYGFKLSDCPSQSGYRYDDLSSESCRMIRTLFEKTSQKTAVLDAFNEIFNKPQLGYIMLCSQSEMPDYRLLNIKGVIRQMISGGVLMAEPISNDWYRIKPANAFFNAKVLRSFNKLLEECRRELQGNQLTQSTVAFFQPAADATPPSLQAEEVIALRK